MAFTFKTTKPAGKYRSFYPNHYAIKLGKKEVGYIADNESFKIHLMIKKEVSKEDPAPFKWITLIKESSSVQGAKDFLNTNFDKIIEKFDLYQIEN